MVFIGAVRTLWYYWSRQNIVVLDIGAGRTLWYLLEQVEHCGIYWSR